MSELIAEPQFDTPGTTEIAGLGPPPGAVESAPPTFSLSEEQWQESQAQQAAIAEWIQAQAQPQGQPQGPQYPSLDPFAEDYAQQHAAFTQQVIREAMAPYAEWQQTQQMGEANERALDILDDITSREGEFMVQEKAYESAIALANVYLPEESERHGWGPKAAEVALQRAAAEVRAYEKAIADAALNQHTNRLRTLDGAPGEPGTQYAVGTQQHTTPDYRSGLSVADRMFGNG